MVMFGRKDRENRRLEDMYAPVDEEIVEDFDEESDFESIESEKEEKDKHNDSFTSAPIKPLECFGMDEGKTEKWLMKCVKFWYCIMSFFWFLFGALTFAPVIFISNKVDVLFNDRKKSLLCGMAIYIVVVALFVLIFAIGGGEGASQVVEVETITEAITTEVAEVVKTR
jgi:hypothetical protein